MKRSQIKILLVEDDPSQGRSLQEALKRYGYDVYWASNADDAQKLATQGEFKLAIVDCLLPKTSGVEFAENLSNSHSDDIRIILTSGIYKDKNFTRDALQRTRASAYVSKPFEIEKLFSLIDEVLGNLLDPDLPPLIDTLTLNELNADSRLKAVAETQSIHGFDLPLVYSVIFGSHLSGRMVIMSSDGHSATLLFRNGELTQAEVKDTQSYFGVLLVEMGFTSTEEVEDVLGQSNSRPIGERLVAAHSLSPHAIRIVRQEQMVIRLSQTVQDQFVDVSFERVEVAESDESLNKERFQALAWDWICSKITPDWLVDFYNQWLEYPIVLIEPALIKRRLSTLPGLEHLDGLLAKLSQKNTINELTANGVLIDGPFLSVLHLLLIEKMAYFGQRRASAENQQQRLKRLQKLLGDMAKRDHFQILGLSTKVAEKEIHKAYMDLAKTFHPDKLEPNAGRELRQVTDKIFARISEAYEALKDGKKRAQYLVELQQGSAEKILQNESAFEQGLSHLRKGKYKLALDIFARLATQRQHRADLSIYLAWSKLKVGAPDTKVEQFLKSIGDMINRVPPEDRHSAPYFYTKALFYLQIGELEKAKTNFKHALLLDPNFVEARRDLTVTRSRLRVANEGPDLSTVVTRLLGRRK